MQYIVKSEKENSNKRLFQQCAALPWQHFWVSLILSNRYQFCFLALRFEFKFNVNASRFGWFRYKCGIRHCLTKSVLLDNATHSTAQTVLPCCTLCTINVLVSFGIYRLQHYSLALVFFSSFVTNSCFSFSFFPSVLFCESVFSRFYFI